MSKRSMWDSLLADIAEILTAYDVDGTLPSHVDEHGIKALREVLQCEARNLAPDIA